MIYIITKMYLWLIILCFHHISALPAIIRIGGIFGQHDKAQELAFKYAVQVINMNRKILPSSRIEPTTIHITADDSFHASKKVCQLIRSGVAAIFGPKSDNTANHVQSICNTLGIPHIETRWKYNLIPDTYSVNLYPHPKSMSTAYYDVITTLGWTSFTILYDSNAGLVRLESLLTVKAWTVGLRELEGDDWRPLIKELKKFKVTKLVIDVAQEKIYDVLNQAKQLGLMTEYYSYFLTSLDMNLINMSEFRHGGSNITSLRLIDPENERVQLLVERWSFNSATFTQMKYAPKVNSITTESALMHDAVHLFASALDKLDRTKVVDIVPLHCDVGKTWSHGSALVNLMKWYGSNRYTNQTATYPSVDSYSQLDHGPMAGIGQIAPYQANLERNRSLSFIPESDFYDRMSNFGDNSGRGFGEASITGLTGYIKFDTEGLRSDFELQITELDYKKGISQVGRWTKNGGANYTRTYAEISDNIALTLKNRHVIVTSALAAPYTMTKLDYKERQGNDRYEGFCMDLIHNISQELKFNYTIKLAPGNSYGSLDPETGEYNGMIGELLNHRADLAIVDFTITYEREEVVDFSMPFMNLGIGIIYKKPQKKAPRLFSFMSPFSVDVWIFMATAYLGVSVLLFILARITPNEWDNPHPCIQDPDELENTITLSNAFWFTIGSLMQQGSDIAPKAVSTRIVASIWWFFTLIMISSYTANLAAFLTVERMESPITGADDLAKQSKIKYGCKDGGSTGSFFKSSKIPTYKRMHQAMINARPTVFMETNDEGVDKVSDSDGMYAFLMESSSIEYNVERKCDLTQVGGLLDAKSYGIALPPFSPYTGAISSAILKRKENGVLHEFKTKWWKKRRGGGKCKTELKKDLGLELGLANVGGVFVVMTLGCISAVFVGCFEFFWKARKLVGGENTFTAEIWNELRFVWAVGENTKQVRKRKESSTYDSSTNFDYDKVEF